METSDRLTAVEADGITADARIARLESEVAGLHAIIDALFRGVIVGRVVAQSEGLVIRFFAGRSEADQ